MFWPFYGLHLFEFARGAINTHDAYIPCHIQPWSAYAHHILYMLYMFLAAHEVFVSTSTLPLSLALSVIFVRIFFSTFLPHFPRYKLMSIFQVLSGLRSRGLWSRVHRSIGPCPPIRPSIGPFEAIAWRQFSAKCYSKYLADGRFSCFICGKFRILLMCSLSCALRK